jgi:UDP-3-O-[3-hydroxymyristoyl] glucosamine N-acyltransferase
MPIASDVILGENVVIFHKDLVNLYGCRVGASTKIGTFVEIQKGAVIGQRCKISSHTFVCEGVTIEDDVFVGHGVVFINDPRPRATIHGRPQTEADWTCRAHARRSRRIDRKWRDDYVWADDW